MRGPRPRAPASTAPRNAGGADAIPRGPRGLGLLLAVLASGLAARAALAGTSIGYVSQPGDYIGQGQTELYTDADGTFTASTFQDPGAHIDFDDATEPGIWWSLDLDAPQSVRLTPGTYDNAQVYPSEDPREPGLSFSGSGRGCGTVTGSFAISDVVYDWFGNLARLAATFTQHCEGEVPALFGTIDFRVGTLGPVTFDPKDVLVTYGNDVFDFARDGTLVQEIPILGGDQAAASGEVARDLVRDSSGRVHVFNGTLAPVLSTFSPTSGEWTEEAQSGWSSDSVPAHGGIAAFGSLVFVSATTSFGHAGVGLFRFDANQVLPTVQFASANPYVDVAAGLDGRLYGLRSDGKHVDAFDPQTLAPLGSANLATAVNGIAVDGTGRIFAATGNLIYRFDSTGAIQTSLDADFPGLADIDLSPSGAIVVGTTGGHAVLTDATLATSTSFPVAYEPSAMTFVAFAEGAPDLKPLFHDGFESGNTDAWTFAQP